MKQIWKKLGYSILILCLVLAAMPVLAEGLSIQAAWNTTQTYAEVVIPGIWEADQQIRVTQTKGEAQGLRLLSTEEYATDLAQPAAQLREAMKDRQDAVTVKYAVTGQFSYDQLAQDLLDAAMAHTGQSTEGDYLMWQRGRVKTSFAGASDGTTSWLDITVSLSYYTTAEQEVQMDVQVDDLLESLELEGKTDYEKLRAVYDWMTAEIFYDYENLYDDSYELKYTAYAALMDRTAVCQGYALLLYRLMLEEGIDCRVITGIGNGGGHAWNIVKLDGKYYNLDATWDASRHQGGLEYNFFLRTDATFEDHARGEDYASEEFYTAYPMGSADYTQPAVTQIAGGACGGSLTWVLTDDGTLTVFGEGEMEDYEKAEDAPWYDYRENVLSVVVSNGVCSIGRNAFHGYKKLAYVSISPSIVRIGAFAFADCYDLYSAHISDLAAWCQIEFENAEANPVVNTPVLGGLYLNGEWIRDLVIPEGLTSISDYAFHSNFGITTVTIPDSVTHIGKSAFYYCGNLESVTMGTGVTTIDDQAFYSCLRLTDISLPDSVTTIGYAAFSACESLREIIIPDSVTTLGESVFFVCYQLSNVVLGNGITEIPELAFGWCYALTNVEIPNGVTDIGTMAFGNCWELRTVFIPVSVQTIEDDAFGDSSKLWHIFYEGTEESWNQILIRQTPYYDEVWPSVTRHYNCTGDEMVAQTVAPTCMEGGYTVYTCSICGECYTYNQVEEDIRYGHKYDNGFCVYCGLEDDAFADGQCGDHLYWNYYADGRLIIYGYGPMYDFEVGDQPWGAFRETMVSVTIRDGATSIGNNAFSDYDCITSVAIAGTVTWIGKEAFCDCASLQYVTFQEGLEAIGRAAFRFCGAIETLSLPTTLYTISSYAFDGCDLLDELYVGKGVAYIEEHAFPADMMLFCYENSAAHNYARWYYQPVCAAPEGMPLGHHYETVVVEQTCTQEGYTKHTCVYCQDSYTENVQPAPGHNYVETEIPATCTEHGYYIATCSVCGDSYQYGYIDPAHSMSEWVETQPSTCTETGIESRSCVNCGWTETRVSDVREHSYEMVVNKPTCTERGYTKYTCSVCGDSYVEDVVLAIGHSYECEETKAPTCEEMGELTYTCVHCGDYYTNPISPLYHYLSHVVNQKEPTCGIDGYTGDTVCDICGEVIGIGDIIPATGNHSYSVIYMDPTCETAGGWTYTCEVCGSQHVEELPAYGHTTYVTNAKEPTCAEPGYSGDEVCSTCGKIVAYGWEIAPTDHDYTLVNAVDATCGKDGYTGDEVCTLCGYVLRYGQTIPASGEHSYQVTVLIEPGCEYTGLREYYCTVCGYYYTEEIPARGQHEYVSTVIAEPGCTYTGMLEKRCTICGESYWEEVPAKGHSYVETVIPPTCTEGGYTAHTCSVCGDYFEDSFTDAVEHAMGQWYAVQQPTCTEGGIEQRNCVHCGYSETREAAALGHSYDAVVIAPSCTDQGYTIYTCVRCGDSYTADYTPMLEHDYNYQTITTPPTCTEDGTVIYICRCGASYTEVLPATNHATTEIRNRCNATCGMDGYTGDTVCADCGILLAEGEVIPATGDHTFGEWSILVEPTDLMEGLEIRYCINCGFSETQPIPKLDHIHDYTYYEETANPDCVHSGYILHGCRCGDSYTEVLPALGHEEVVTPGCPATCTEDGWTESSYCAVCNECLRTVERIPAFGHSFGTWYTVTEPGEYTDGEERRDCSVCGHFETRIIPAAGHTHSYEAVVTAPTCTDGGYTTYTCRCGDSYIADETPALGHDYKSVVTAPTCTEGGYTTYTCENCGAAYTGDHVAALGHNYEAVITAPTCDQQGYTTHTCSVCGDSYTDSYVDALGHVWNEGEVTKKPTVEAEGEKTYTCTVCGATRTESISKKEPVIYDIPDDDSVTIPENDCFEGGTTVTVEKVEEGEIFEEAAQAMENRAENYMVFEFTATKDEAAVQPNGKLTVTFDIPAEYSTNVSVYYLDENGRLTKLDVVVDANARTVTVELAHFSTYILADEDSAPTVLLGDVNGDGRVNARDARLLLRYIAGLTEEGEVDKAAADFNGDGRVNARDARAILQYIAGIH